MIYKILGKSPDTEEEEIDQTPFREEVDQLLAEYGLAYSDDWTFRVVEE